MALSRNLPRTVAGSLVCGLPTAMPATSHKLRMAIGQVR